jgi:hypothetical protein
VSLHSTPGAGTITYYSGFDGQNVYEVPMAFVGDGQTPTFAAQNTSIANMVTTLRIDHSTNAQVPAGVVMTGVLFQTYSAGQTTINATYKGMTYSAQLLVTQYTTAEVALGDQRYNNPANANTTNRVSCVSCHGSIQDVHATASLDDLSDDKLVGIAVDGDSVTQVDPTTGQIQTVMPNNGDHKWDVTGPERAGVPPFFRSRSPLFDFHLP